VRRDKTLEYTMSSSAFATSMTAGVCYTGSHCHLRPSVCSKINNTLLIFGTPHYTRAIFACFVSVTCD